jgi:hypothetical protein
VRPCVNRKRDAPAATATDTERVSAAPQDGSTTSFAELTDRDLRELLEQLKRDEERVSRQRTALHKRIEFVQGGGSASADQSVDDLATLVATEHEISQHRHELQRQIDDLRTEQSRRGGHWSSL